MANSDDAGQTPQSVMADLGVYCLLRPICRNKQQNTIYFVSVFLVLSANHIGRGCIGLM